MNISRCQSRHPDTCRFHSSSASQSALSNLQKAKGVYEKALDLYGQKVSHLYLVNEGEVEVEQTLVVAKRHLEISQQAYNCTSQGLSELQEKILETPDKPEVEKLKTQFAIAKQLVDMYDKKQGLDARIDAEMDKALGSDLYKGFSDGNRDLILSGKRTKRVKAKTIQSSLNISPKDTNAEILQNKIDDLFKIDPTKTEKVYMDDYGQVFRKTDSANFNVKLDS